MRKFLATSVTRLVGWSLARRRVGLLKPHFYSEYLLLLVVLPITAFLLFALLIFPNAVEADRTEENWTKNPHLVWTKADSAEVARQIKASANSADGLHIPTDMWGPGPPAVDLSTFYRNAEFNAITAELNRQHRDRLLMGSAFAGSFSAENPPALYGRLARMPAGGRGESIAFQKALVAFRNSGWEQSARDLESASCGNNPPLGLGSNNDPDARKRLWAIRCSWLKGRLSAQARDRAGAVSSLRDAVVQVNNSLSAQRTAELLPPLLPGDYMMNLPREGTASLWQDYLSALLTFEQPLCDGPCKDDGTNRNDDGKMVDFLIGQSAAGEIWTSYPDLAVLARLLLIREGQIAKARVIIVPVKSVNSSAAGFFVQRFANQPAEYRLHDHYHLLAQLSEVMIAMTLPEDTGLREIDTAPVIEFWKAHASARLARLKGSQALPPPGESGSEIRSKFDTFQDQWHSEWTGGWLPDSIPEYLISAILGILLALFIFGRRALWNLGKRRTADWEAVVESAFHKGRPESRG